ncbi:GNAT family N-acetyltransferase [Sphingomonas suaedae]|uniref:GNAT family N-acetyltransferase n=1 Tax=Sphingomonas suaedae TaxID=2599297 RepID=A0A518RK68_9SPHN|nr:GNAT family N-acetyltransferase [Sphingomonas suaedae]QDX27833.1 GNAT family N-acetyltransferase [Sphingomonas suaedae]
MTAATAIDLSNACALPARHAPALPGAEAEWLPLSPLADRLCEEWDALAAEAAEPDVFAQRWFADASAALAPPDARLLAIRSAGRLIGLMPVGRDSRYGRLPLRHSVNWVHYHRFLGAPLLRRGQEVAAWSAIIAALDADRDAGSLLHLTGLVENGPVHRGLIEAARLAGRPCDTVHRIERAMLASDMAPDAYYAATVRKKKRKEIARLRARLAEQGSLETRRLAADASPHAWTDAFLALEHAGWKGAAGSALACTPETSAFFREVVAQAHRAGRLDFLRLDLDGAPIAMLVNLIAAPGAFAFKTAYDEGFARFSPGVLLQIENLQILARDDIDWVDSCAVENHPMIDSLWGQRRAIVRVTLPLAGRRRRIAFTAARTLERSAAAFKSLRNRRPQAPQEDSE